MALPPGLAVAHGNSPYITIYDQEGDVFTKVANPDVLPPNESYAIAFSPDNTYLAVPHFGSPYVTIYKRSGDTFTKLPNPVTLPPSTGNSAVFSPDGIHLAVSHDNHPYITIYKRDGDTFTKLANPATLPPGNTSGVVYSGDGTHLVFSHSASPHLTIYKRDGDTYTKLANPAVLPPSTGTSCSFSPDSTYLVIGHLNSPYLTIYKRDGDTFTKLTDPASLPSGHTYEVAFTSDSIYMAVPFASVPHLIIYKRDGDTFTKLADPAVMPNGASYGADFSPDNVHLAVLNSSTPYVTIYKRDVDTFTKLADPAVLPAGTGRGLSFMHALAALLSGTVTENGTPVSRTVRAYRRDTGALLGETVSAGGEVDTWNPADKGASLTLTEGDLKCANNTGAIKNELARSVIGKTAGKYYFEVTVLCLAGTYKFGVGVANASESLTKMVGQAANSWGYLSNGDKHHSNSATAYGNAYSSVDTGVVIGVAVDLDSGSIWFSNGGVWQNSGDPAAGTNPAFTNLAGTIHPAISPRESTSSFNPTGLANFGTSPFVYSPPSGFSAWEAAGDGSFSIDTGGYTGECQVVVLDDDAGTAYNALIAGRVVPVSG